MGFYCSEKFRLNSNSLKVDVWLIYKCQKCDTTWKLSLMRGIKPNDITPVLFDKLTNNDKELAWQYAFDRQLLKQSGCVVDYGNIGYTVEVLSECDIPHDAKMHTGHTRVHIKSQYFFDLKLSTFLAAQLGISVSQLRKLVEQGLITTGINCDIMKYRIRAEFTINL